MKFAESGEYGKDALHQVGKTIHQTISWDDPIDAISIHAYILRSQHEAFVEDKCKREVGNEDSSKKALRSEKSRQQTIPTGEEMMKDAPSTSKDKNKGAAYKLQSDIEAAPDLKKVLEERILIAKVEFTLGEVLGIAKQEFHGVMIDIIQSKRQTMGETMTSNAHGARMVRDEEGEGKSINNWDGGQGETRGWRLKVFEVLGIEGD